MRALSAAKRALLAERLRGRRQGGRPMPPPRPEPEGGRRAPLSVAQEHLWYLTRLAPDEPVYNELVTISKDGPLSIESLQAALSELVHRQEIWRSTFAIEDGQPVQVVHPARPVDLPFIDLSGRSPADAEREAVGLAAQEARRPYRLDQGPLLRPLLIRLGADRHRLYLALHHLIFDGISLYRVVLPELVALYDAYDAGHVPNLPQPLIQYADYAARTRTPAATARAAGRIGHWRRRLGDAPQLLLPLDHPRPAVQGFHGAMLPIRIDAALVAELRSLSRQSGGTLFATVASAFAILMHRYTGQDDVVFGTLCDLRDRSELHTMVGYCMTPLVLRVDLAGDPTFAQLLHRVRSELVDALDHVVPFATLVRELRPPRQPGANPIFQAMLVIEPPMKPVGAGWSLRQMETEIGNAVGHAKFDLHLELDERPEGHIDGRLIYRTDLFDPPTAERMVGHWLALLEGVVREPGQPISTVPLLTGAEHRQLSAWNETTTSAPRDVCVHTMVSEQAQRTPDAIALVCGDHTMTFGELDRRANRLAHRLRRAGAATGEIVALCVDRTPGMVVGMLAVLKSGAAYLPLDPDDPPARLAEMIEDSGATVLLTETSRLATLPHGDRAVVFTDADGHDRAGEDDAPPESPTTAADPVYVIYTSGSTGRPKGVVVRHAALANLLDSLSRAPGMGPEDTLVAVTTYSFDIAAVEIWLPLVTGARIVLASRAVASDGRLLIRCMASAGVTVMQATPATWRMLVDAGWERSPGMRALCGGEPLPPRLAEQILDRAAELWNLYGPTETTVWSTCGRVERGSPITIGRPIANTRVYILDASGAPVAVGVAGELCIGGRGVADGYLHRPELTAERFVADPFADGEVMYRTGDRARFLDDGTIEHLGRSDHQLKVRGFRIEPGEIEAELLAQPEVDAAVVVASTDADGDQRLVAYVASSGGLLPARDLRARLRTRLPDHMVPTAIIGLASLPLNSSGKIDRAALPAPDWSQQETATRAQAPRSELEESLARLWAGTLGLDRAVGIDENFFDVGGHSLLAARLLVEVDRALGVELPLASIVNGAGTIAGMAALINEMRGASAATPVATSQVRRLFIVYPDPSSMLTMRHFSATLASECVLVGLEPGFGDRLADEPRSIGEFAVPLIERIRAEQPGGPYHIAGYSVGGHLAYEIAGRLMTAGEDVAWLGLIDCGTPAAVERHLRWLSSLRGRWDMVVRVLREGPRAALQTSGELTTRRLHVARAWWPKRPHAVEAGDFDWRGAMAMAARHASPAHDAPLDLFVTAEMVLRTGSESLGWADLHRGPLRVHTVPGDHLSMLVAPHVRVLAEALAASIQRPPTIE